MSAGTTSIEQQAEGADCEEKRAGSDKPVGLVRATSVVMTATIVSAGFGLVREMLVAQRFGATAQTDAYFFAFDLIVGLPEFLLGGMVGALIPIYTHCKRSGQDTPYDFASTIINVYLVYLLIAVVVLSIGAPLLSSTLAGGLDDASRELVTRFIWMLAPTVLLAGIWMIMKAMLEADGHFLVSQISTGFVAVGIIVAVLLLVPSIGIYSLPVGVLGGVTVRTVWVAFWLRKSGFKYRWTMNTGLPEFRRYLALLGPGIAAGVIAGMIPIMDKSMASHLPAGTIATLSFAGRPMGLVTRFGLYALVTAMLPTLAWQAMQQDRAEFRGSISQILGMLIFVTTPLALILAALRVPIIQVLFQRGDFDAEATVRTASIFGVLILGLMPLTVATTLSTVFKAMEDTKTVAVLGGGGNLVSKILFNFAFIVPFGVLGLAMASALQHVVSGLLLLESLRRRLNGIGIRSLSITCVKVVPASLLACMAVHATVVYWHLPPLLLCMFGFVIGSTLFIILAAALRTKELSMLFQYVLSRLQASDSK